MIILCSAVQIDCHVFSQSHLSCYHVNKVRGHVSLSICCTVKKKKKKKTHTHTNTHNLPDNHVVNNAYKGDVG
jgi:hypothetical protein